MVYYKKSFTPKKPVKTFRDLDVYQKPLECAVLISKDIAPQLVKNKYPYAERMTDCAMAVPLLVAEAHSLRFADFALGVGYLEKSWKKFRTEYADDKTGKGKGKGDFKY